MSGPMKWNRKGGGAVNLQQLFIGVHGAGVKCPLCPRILSRSECGVKTHVKWHQAQGDLPAGESATTYMAWIMYGCSFDDLRRRREENKARRRRR
jgi:hypothetical protein